MKAFYIVQSNGGFYYLFFFLFTKKKEIARITKYDLILDVVAMASDAVICMH